MEWTGRKFGFVTVVMAMVVVGGISVGALVQARRLGKWAIHRLACKGRAQAAWGENLVSAFGVALLLRVGDGRHGQDRRG